MASYTAPTTLSHREPKIQRRHTIAAVVYLLYGVFYLFGAQYITSMGETERGMSSGSSLFFILGGVVAVLFPLLVYNRFAFALSLRRPSSQQRKTAYLNFTLILGLLVVLRVVALFRGGLYLKTPLHTSGLVIAAVTALFLLWAGFSQPAWISRDVEGAD